MNSIILYSTGCPRCEVLKSKLADKSIPYTENNSVLEMKNLGITELPVLSINGTMLNFKEAVEWVNKQLIIKETEV